MSELYEHLYGIDLVYQRDCYKLCGDAYCCSFARATRSTSVSWASVSSRSSRSPSAQGEAGLSS